jgi:nitrate/nitrite transporter NarK
MTSHTERIGRRLITVTSIAFSCAALGIGIGFAQGEIVARAAAQDEQLVFAGSAGMIGGLIAFFLGPILYYSLKQRIAFEHFCCTVAASLAVGCVSAWLFSIRPNGPGWESMFVTPVAAVCLAIFFTRKENRKETSGQE